jgi:hypothetical protein
MVLWDFDRPGRHSRDVTCAFGAAVVRDLRLASVIILRPQRCPHIDVKERGTTRRAAFVLFEDFAMPVLPLSTKDNGRSGAPEVLFPVVLAPTLCNVHRGGFI